MRTPLVTSLWTAYLGSQLPCHPDHMVWSREHVIPKSIIPSKPITENIHNLIPMPKRLNNARGNRPYTDECEDGYIVYACAECPNPGLCRASAVVSRSGVLPPDVFKGPIARSVLHSVGRFPKLHDSINSKVLDLDIAIKWDSQFPMSVQEQEWFNSII